MLHIAPKKMVVWLENDPFLIGGYLVTFQRHPSIGIHKNPWHCACALGDAGAACTACTLKCGAWAKVEGDLIPWDVQVFAYSGYTFGFRLKQGNVGNIPENITNRLKWLWI